MFKFKSKGWYHIKGIGTCVAVDVPVPITNPKTALVGQEVLIDGKIFKVHSYESHCTSTMHGPWRVGRPIGLLIERDQLRKK